MFQRLYFLFRTRMFNHLFSMLYFSWSVIIARFIEHQTETTIEQFNEIRRTRFLFKN